MAAVLPEKNGWLRGGERGVLENKLTIGGGVIWNLGRRLIQDQTDCCTEVTVLCWLQQLSRSLRCFSVPLLCTDMSELSIFHGDMASAVHLSLPLDVWMDLRPFLKFELSLGNVVVCVDGEYQVPQEANCLFYCTKPSVVPLQGLQK